MKKNRNFATSLYKDSQFIMMTFPALSQRKGNCSDRQTNHTTIP